MYFYNINTEPVQTTKRLLFLKAVPFPVFLDLMQYYQKHNESFFYLIMSEILCSNYHSRNQDFRQKEQSEWHVKIV